MENVLWTSCLDVDLPRQTQGALFKQNKDFCLGNHEAYTRSGWLLRDVLKLAGFPFHFISLITINKLFAL